MFCIRKICRQSPYLVAHSTRSALEGMGRAASLMGSGVLLRYGEIN
jgi:hypothetical protein